MSESYDAMWAAHDESYDWDEERVAEEPPPSALTTAINETFRAVYASSFAAAINTPSPYVTFTWPNAGTTSSNITWEEGE